MDTRQKGEVASLKAQQRAIEKGFVVSRPTTDARYDLVLDDGVRLIRAQAKYGGGKSSHSSGVATVALRTWVGPSNKSFKKYEVGEVDLLLVYLPEMDVVTAFLPEEFQGKSILHVRLEAPANGAKKNILLASDHVW